ncbi:MAG: FAD-dependent oxidoreductase [Elusimicrobiota bacterium]
MGAAYFVQNDDEIGALLAEAGLKLASVRKPLDRWYIGGKWVVEPWDEPVMAGLPPGLRRAMRGLKKALEDVSEGPDYPHIPYRRSSRRALELDRISFAEWLKPYAHPDLMPFLISYCYSAMGAPPEMVSAYGGVNFYSEILADIHAPPIGNAAIVKSLVQGIESAGAGRIRNGCHVHKVSPAPDGSAIVRYVRGGDSLAVKAKRVVLAVPYFAASALLDPLPDGQRYALKAQQYASYVVANLCFDRRVSLESYASSTGGKVAFEDFIPADWVAGTPRPGGAGGPQVITVFAPLRESLAGRWRLLSAAPEEFAAPFVQAFEKLVPGASRHLREAHMTRWGHAILVNRPGMFTRWLPSIQKRIGPVLLAHSDGQGLPAFESAVYEGLAAARHVLEAWR